MNTMDGLLAFQTMDGLPASPPRRSYMHKICNRKPPTCPRVLGMRRKDKVTLTVVMDAKSKKVCSKRCLQKISAFDLLSLRYEAWRSKDYKHRAS